MDEEAVRPKDGATGEGVRSKILIVEDEFIMSVYLKDAVTAMGFSAVGIAASGQEAIELARLHKPDLVLMDIKLIGPMDGIDAGRVIGAELNIPIIFASGSVDAGTRARIASLPTCRGVLCKPFPFEELRDCIQSALARWCAP